MDNEQELQGGVPVVNITPLFNREIYVYNLGSDVKLPYPISLTALACSAPGLILSFIIIMLNNFLNLSFLWLIAIVIALPLLSASILRARVFDGNALYEIAQEAYDYRREAKFFADGSSKYDKPFKKKNLQTFITFKENEE